MSSNFLFVELPRITLIMTFCRTMKIQATSPAQGRIVLFESFGPDEGLKPVKILYTWIKDEVGNKDNLLKDGKVY